MTLASVHSNSTVPSPLLSPEAREDLNRYAESGGFTLRAETHPWYAAFASVSRLDEARAASTVLAELRGHNVPDLQQATGHLAKLPGFAEPTTVRETAAAVALLLRVRSTLEVLRPEAYAAEADALDALLAATATPAWRAERGVSQSWWQRTRLARRARALTASRGASRTDLHSALAETAATRTEWAALVGSGARPSLPADTAFLDTAGPAAEAALTGLEQLTLVLRTESEAALEDLPFAELTSLLDRLASDEGTLYRLPRLRELHDALVAQGLGDLLAQLTEQQADVTATAAVIAQRTALDPDTEAALVATLETASVEIESEFEAGFETETETETETVAEAEVIADSPAEVEPVAEADTELVADTETEPETLAEPEALTATEFTTEAELAAETEPETRPETEQPAEAELTYAVNSWPTIDSEPAAEAVEEPEFAAEDEVVADSPAEAEVVAESDAEMAADTETEPETVTAPEALTATELTTEAELAAETQPEAQQSAEAAVTYAVNTWPVIDTEPTAETLPLAETTTEAEAEAEAEADTEPATEAAVTTEALAEPGVEDEVAPVVEAEVQAEPAVEAVAEAEPAAEAEAASAQPSRSARPDVPAGKPVTAYSAEQLEALVRWIDGDGVDRTDEELLRAAMKDLGFARLGPRIKEALGAAVAAARG